jgi:hypothetical protein
MALAMEVRRPSMASRSKLLWLCMLLSSSIVTEVMSKSDRKQVHVIFSNHLVRPSLKPSSHMFAILINQVANCEGKSNSVQLVMTEIGFNEPVHQLGTVVDVSRSPD